VSHHCHAAACHQGVPPEMLMCARHWRMVPQALKREVWRTYRQGQCDDMQISHEYAVAARAAVTAVAKLEGVGAAEIAKAVQVYEVLDPERGRA
jgi:UDP-N-acetylmuramoylalanine-D-glutamate ligase